jgi:hypothetical protein
MTSLDSGKILYIVRAVLLYWLALAAFSAVVYGLPKLSTGHQYEFGIALLFATCSGFVGWIAASTYRAKRQAKEWQKEREKWDARYRRNLES